jgi:hypothetical protein
MVDSCAEYKDIGYSEVILSYDDVQYYFKEWFEDENGNEKLNVKLNFKNNFGIFNF